MSNTMNMGHFASMKESLERDLIVLSDYEKVNDFLIKNGWLFVSPLFFQGIELDYFLQLSKKEGDQKKNINDLIFNKFFNLNWAASFIDGYCKRCMHIEPFLESIEHSLVLAFQKDYEGSIKTLIPIVEGILRKYLKVEKEFEHKIKFDTLRKSFKNLKDDLVLDYSRLLSNYIDENNQRIAFTQEQVNELILLQAKYYETWFSFIINFIDNSFYFRLDGLNNDGLLNRHDILHEFGSDIHYNLENYIKVYFVIQFLTWIFLRKEGKSPLNEISGFRFIEKIESYKNIIELSNKVIYEKHLLYKGHKGYNQELLREKFNVTIGENLPFSKYFKYKILRNIDKFLWKKKLK